MGQDVIQSQWQVLPLGFIELRENGVNVEPLGLEEGEDIWKPDDVAKRRVGSCRVQGYAPVQHAENGMLLEVSFRGVESREALLGEGGLEKGDDGIVGDADRNVAGPDTACADC